MRFTLSTPEQITVCVRKAVRDGFAAAGMKGARRAARKVIRARAKIVRRTKAPGPKPPKRPTPAADRKYVKLSPERKTELVEALGKGLTYREASERYGVSTATVGNILRAAKKAA